MTNTNLPTEKQRAYAASLRAKLPIDLANEIARDQFGTNPFDGTIVKSNVTRRAYSSYIDMLKREVDKLGLS